MSFDERRDRETKLRRKRYRHGLVAEGAAELALRLKGYRILDRRFKTPAGEIDLVARRGRRVAFVEVKLRATFDEAAEAVTPRLRERVKRAALLWLQRYDDHGELDPGFDVMLLTPWRWPRHIIDAFPFA